MKLRQNRSLAASGSTLVEVLVAALVVGIFFASIFEVNAVCLRIITASKENVGAIEAVQDRIEVLRNSSFSTLTSDSAMKTLLTSPGNPGPMGLIATETVTISTLTNGVASTPKAVFVRAPGASVAPTSTWTPLGTTSFGTVTVVQLDVQYTWPSTFGGRSHTETASTILTDGTKK